MVRPRRGRPAPGGGPARLGGADKPGIRVGGGRRCSPPSPRRRRRRRQPARGGRAGEARRWPSELAAHGDARVEFTTRGASGRRAGARAAGRPGRSSASPGCSLLAADLPFLTGPHLRVLRRAAAAAGQRSPAHRRRWQAAVAGQLLADRGAAGRAGRLRGQRRSAACLARCGQAQVAIGTRPGAPPWLDCDTQEDLAAARALAERRQGRKARDEHAGLSGSTRPAPNSASTGRRSTSASSSTSPGTPPTRWTARPRRSPRSCSASPSAAASPSRRGSRPR